MPSSDPAAAERVHAETRAQWRSWLSENHRTSRGVWLVSWKAHTGRARVAYNDAVEEALCFGWVDSRGGKVDDDRTMLWFTPRQRGSAWARSNKTRVERLLRDGAMAPAGIRVVEQAQADGSWTALDDVEDLVVPPDLAEALATLPGARRHFDGFPRSVRRGILEWISTAKRPATRRRRVAETARLAARNERANQWRPPAER